MLSWHENTPRCSRLRSAVPKERKGSRRRCATSSITLAAIDAPLVAIVAVASYLLARATIAPLEAARERERVFAADAAHELRSPLSAIAAVAQAARANGRSRSAGRL